MHLQLDHPTRLKTILHSIQALTIFIAWCLTIGVFTQPGRSDGRTGWYFGLCWLSLPALLYLTMVPLWPRTARLASPYALATLDMLFCVLWFTAFAAVASYVSSGKNKKPSNCENFSHGSATRCKLSEASVLLGVVVCLLFAGTGVVSVRGVVGLRGGGGVMPGTINNDDEEGFAKQTEGDFSSRLPDEEGVGTGGLGTRQHPNNTNEDDDDDEYALLHRSDAAADDDVLAHPGRPVSYGHGPYDSDEHDRGVGYAHV